MERPQYDRKKPELELLTTDPTPPVNIILIQESRLATSSIFDLEGFTIFRKDTDYHPGLRGLVTLVDETLSCKPIEFSLSDPELEVRISHINSGDSCFYLVNIYASHETIHVSHWERLFEFLHDKDFILTGDFNAHHEVWSSAVPTQRGEEIKALIDDHGFTIGTQRRQPNKTPTTTKYSYYPRSDDSPSKIW